MLLLKIYQILLFAFFSLVCGDVNGKFNKLFTKVESINSKAGPFEYLFCVGNFFGDSSSSAEWNLYKNGTFTGTTSK